MKYSMDANKIPFFLGTSLQNCLIHWTIGFYLKSILEYDAIDALIIISGAKILKALISGSESINNQSVFYIPYRMKNVGILTMSLAGELGFAGK